MCRASTGQNARCVDIVMVTMALGKLVIAPIERRKPRVGDLFAVSRRDSGGYSAHVVRLSRRVVDVRRRRVDCVGDADYCVSFRPRLDASKKGGGRR